MICGVEGKSYYNIAYESSAQYGRRLYQRSCPGLTENSLDTRIEVRFVLPRAGGYKALTHNFHSWR